MGYLLAVVWLLFILMCFRPPSKLIAWVFVWLHWLNSRRFLRRLTGLRSPLRVVRAA